MTYKQKRTIMKKRLQAIIALTLLTYVAAFAQTFSLVDSYPAEGGRMKTLHGQTLTWSFNEDVKKVIFYVHNATTDKQITMKMIDAADAKKDFSYYFDPSVGNSDIYSLPYSHEIEIRWTAYYSYNSSFSNKKAGEGTIHITGDDENAKTLSTTVQFQSITPSPNGIVLSDNDGTMTDIPVVLTFSDAVASATAWIAIAQSKCRNLTVSINGNTVSLNIPTESASGAGTCSLFVQAKDAEGHIIGDREGTVNPIDGYLQFSYLSEIGLPSPQLTENGRELNELSSLQFVHTSPLSMNNDISAGWKNIKILNSNGDVVASEFTAGQFRNSGNNTVVLTLSTPITDNDMYTIEVPYGSFIMGEEYTATKNKSAVYHVTVGSATNINMLTGGKTDSNQNYYNTAGQRVAKDAKGILINNGRKVWQNK